MPTAMISENSTTMLMVRPDSPSTRIPVRNEPGIATPTSSAERGPRAAMTTIITSSTAVRTLFCRSRSMLRMSSDLSWEKPTWMPSGQVARSVSTIARTAATVSMMLAPIRLEISRATAGLPLTRA